MSRYATALAADPYQTYRQIDLAGKTATTEPHKLVALLYDELIRALRTAAIATEQGNHTLKSDRVTKATAILFALEAGLDFANGGEVAVTLSTLYRGVRSRVVDAALGTSPVPFRESADMLAEIAEAWASVGLA